MSVSPWGRIEAEAREAYVGAGRFPLRAYSEKMPPPYVGIKPYAPLRSAAAATCRVGSAHTLDVTEMEQAHELTPGLARVAEVIAEQLGQLVRGVAHAVPRALLDGNPAWPDELAAAGPPVGPVNLVVPVALSRTQDDKGQNRWTLFGASQEGAAGPFWGSFPDEESFARLLAWAGLPAGTRILAEPGELPAFLRARVGDEGPALVSFVPFARLPGAVRRRFLDGALALFPHPASLIFFHAAGLPALPMAAQLPLLHLFHHVDASCRLRVPASGWLDEGGVARPHRWQRVARDEAAAPYHDKVATALFSTEADVLGLYDKPMAQNVQLWTAEHEAVLDGLSADRATLERVAARVDAGGRYAYRFVFPPMRAGVRELYWHVPIVTRQGGPRLPLPGYVTADAEGAERITLAPRFLARPGYQQAATGYASDPGRLRYTTTHNATKILEARDLLGRPLAPSLARALVRAARGTSIDAWIDHLPAAASEPATGAELASELRACLGAEDDPGPSLTLAASRTRTFADTLWRTISELSEGEYRQKDNADAITVNRGRTGGPAAQAAHVHAAERRDLEALGDDLHRRYRELIARHGMEGRAEVVDHVFRWETDWAFPWMGGWAAQQDGGTARERNVVLMIPGLDRGEAVIMGDHYDTAYMEDVYDAERGGDRLRAAAAGADDNHSATTALLLAADALLPLARAGRLARDVWLVHLTGEEFPSDCMGARALCQGLVERSLAFTAEDGTRRDVGHVRAVAAFVLDMIAHNSERDRDVFQIACGEGAGSARLAARAHRANRRWNGLCGPHAHGRAARMPDGREAPGPFDLLPLHGEIRVEWEPRSALYNTDGQIFSDVGIPVVLFMENYDISRTGYHDTHDTMANIDLDYAQALCAIAIETVVETAMSPGG